MVSEKPPRRSKAEKEPVTIDLTAEEAVAEPVRSIDSDEPVTPAELEAETSVDTDKPVEADIADEPVSTTSGIEDEAPLADAEPDDARQPQSATVAPEPEPVPAPPAKRSPAASTLVAAGIFGGIVALALAGSMQYAGYLPGASPATAPAADTTALSSEIAQLRQEIAALQSRPAPTADEGLANRVAALEAATGSTGAVSEEAVSALKDDIALLRSAVESTAGNNVQLEDRIESVEAKMDDRGPEQQVARAIAAAALKAAIDRGGSFETELQTFGSVAGDDPAIADLQKFAAAGVPSRVELQREFPKVADAMLEATSQPDPNQGIAGRLLSSAMSVVKVRRVGNVEGDTPEAIIARIEEALRNGDLKASVREWDALPEPAKATSRDFRQKLDARIQVEDLVGGTLTRAVTGTQG